MAHNACLVCNISTVSTVSTVSGCSKKAKNVPGTGNANSGYITKLEQSRFSLYIYA